MATQFRVLVVDDSNLIRELMRLTLGPMGFTLDFAPTGEQALNQVNQHKYDLIFLDATLPGMDGYKVCKTIKANKTMRQIPIIMLTSRGAANDKVLGAMAGTNAYLVKPIDRVKLVEAIQKLLPGYTRTRHDVLKDSPFNAAASRVAPSTAPRVALSTAPRTVPSIAPRAAPRTVPSTAPRAAPSTAPRAAPSTAPSTASSTVSSTASRAAAFRIR